MTTGPRRLPGAVLCDAMGIKPARLRRAKLANGLRQHLQKLSPSHPTSRCIAATPTGSQAPGHGTAQLLNQRAAYAMEEHTHAAAKAWRASKAAHGDCLEAMCRIRSQDSRRTCIKLRCNLNTFFPGDCLPMTPPSRRACRHAPCSGSKDTLHHRLTSCRQPHTASIRAAALVSIKAQLPNGPNSTPTWHDLLVMEILESAAYGSLSHPRKIFRPMHATLPVNERAITEILRIAMDATDSLICLARDSPDDIGVMTTTGPAGHSPFVHGLPACQA